jgi:hypothetical protein
LGKAALQLSPDAAQDSELAFARQAVEKVTTIQSHYGRGESDLAESRLERRLEKLCTPTIVVRGHEDLDTSLRRCCRYPAALIDMLAKRLTFLNIMISTSPKS